MTGDTSQFAHEHAYRLATLGNLNIGQFLDGQNIGDVVGKRRNVVQSIRIRDELVVSHVLSDLLVAAMQVSEYGFTLGDEIAVQFHNEPEHTVGSGM